MSESPPYTIRVSSRAKRVRLRATRREGIEVVVPRGFDTSRVPHLVRGHRAWMDRATDRLAAERSQLPMEPADGRPLLIELKAVDRVVRAEYVSSDAAHVRVLARGRDGISVTGAVSDVAACRTALRRWLRSEARREFDPWLSRVAATEGLEYERLSVRLQKSRWGSASSTGTISLNAKALFLPEELVDYLILHELCHTVEPNHSARFYAQLTRRMPAAPALRMALRNAWTYVPGWADE